MVWVPAGAANASWPSLTYVTPAPPAVRESEPDGPPTVPAGSITIPGHLDVFVYAPNGFSCAGNPTLGPMWILGFLRAEGTVSCDSTTSPPPP